MSDARRRLVGWGFGFYGAAATVLGIFLIYAALFRVRVKPGRTGDVVGPPDWMWNGFFTAVVLLVALPVLALAGLNAGTCRSVLRNGKSALMHLTARLDALVWALYLLCQAIAIFGLGMKPSPFEIALLVLSLLVPVHLVAAGSKALQAPSQSPPFGHQFLR